MGKKKIAVVDLAESDSPKLKASGVRSQKLTQVKKKDKAVKMPVKKPVKVPNRQQSVNDSSEVSKTKTKKHINHPRSQRYLTAKAEINKQKLYPILKAVKLLKKVSTTNFDPSVELHANLTIDKLSGELKLPHGTGKKLKVEIASQKTLTKLKNNKIDFDILVAEPKMMGKIAKYAKILGPKGLMPNPKTGSISDKPEQVKKKLESGVLRYKSEPKAPIIHLIVGKLSFPDKKLTENIITAIKEFKVQNLKSIYLCTSMSPSLKLQF